MRLSMLLQELYSLPREADCEIHELVLDSRKINPQDVFLALKGTQLDGRKFIPDAIAKKAAAILMETDKLNEPINFHNNVPIVPIHQLQRKLGQLAGLFYSHPVKALRMLGVTGTNGKTSCTHFIAQCLQAKGVACGIIGTLGSGFYGDLSNVGLTTPDAIQLHGILQGFRNRKAQAVAMEVSSHSIDQGRINDIAFEMGMFTNLTQDHLDYHGDMQTYAAVKHRFFAEWPIKHLIINADDTTGFAWLSEFLGHPSIFSYSTKAPDKKLKKIPYVYAQNVQLTWQGINAQVVSPWGEGELSAPLVGQYNLSNILAVLTALCLYGFDFETVRHLLRHLKPVAGRMQTLGGGENPLVIVDYAHTPDALEKVLEALKSHTAGKLICVFGCGGDRDHDKRPLMAKAVEKWADQIIVTNDNPRHENPMLIAKQILTGFKNLNRVTVTLDRSKAIENSIQWASEKDCVLIAGKGAEFYQQIGDERIPFQDVEEVKRVLDK